MDKERLKATAERVLPWVAGAGFAASHIALTTNCTIPREGRCSTCGSCVVALASIVGWALVKKRDDDFYSDDGSHA